jgi:hypothetical protein
LPAFCLSMMSGVALISFVPCFMQMMHIPITASNTAIALGIFTAVCSVPLVVFFQKPRFGKFSLPQLYEVPFFLVFLFLVGTSVWRCFYFPPTPRDVLAGAELLAEFTVKEHTMINSVYSIDLHTTNNYFKSPFLTCLQVIYKLFVAPFGQVWLSTLFVPLVIWLYTLLKDRLHPLLACTLMLLFFAIPDVFAYSYIMLYDYSNMVFFFAGFYFLVQYILDRRNSDFAFAVFLMGISTYIRVETLVFAGLVVLMPMYYFFKEKMPLVQIAKMAGLYMVGPVFFYVLCMNVFLPSIVPIKLDTADQVNQHLGDLSPFFARLSAINSDLIFSAKGTLVYGYYLYLFLGVLVADLLFVRKFNKEARMALYGIAVIYFGLTLLGYLLPLFDLLNTTKRGLFKLIPLILLYYANSGILMKLSDYLKRKEAAIKEPKPVPVAATAAKSKPAAKGKRG